jgi:hypothetical protein
MDSALLPGSMRMCAFFFWSGIIDGEPLSPLSPVTSHGHGRETTMTNDGR